MSELSLSVTQGAGRLINAAQNAISSLYGGTSPILGNAVTQAANLEDVPAAQSEWLVCLPDGSSIAFDSMLRVDVDSANQTMQSPTEQGSFLMYNKVVTPTGLDVQAAFSGRYSTNPAAERQRVTKLLLDLSCTNDLLTIITPEMEFSGYNLEAVRYSRVAEDGVDIIYFDLQFIEIRQVSAQYGNAKLSPKVSKGKQNGPQSAMSGIGDYLGF